MTTSLSTARPPPRAVCARAEAQPEPIVSHTAPGDPRALAVPRRAVVHRQRPLSLERIVQLRLWAGGTSTSAPRLARCRSALGVSAARYAARRRPHRAVAYRQVRLTSRDSVPDSRSGPVLRAMARDRRWHLYSRTPRPGPPPRPRAALATLPSAAGGEHTAQASLAGLLHELLERASIAGR